MVTKTNPAYAFLAHRRSVMVKLAEILREEYMALSSANAKKQVICEEVFREDSIVPQEAISQVVGELEQESETLRLEMLKFTFGKVVESHGLFGRTTNTQAGEAAPDSAAGGDAEEAGSGRSSRRRRRRAGQH